MIDGDNVSLSNLNLTFAGNARATLQNFNFNLKAGKWTCILGRSGCGKTTLLKLLAGLLQGKQEVSLSGFVNWQGQQQDLSQMVHKENSALAYLPDVAYMAQQDLLFPWLTVLDNACLSAKFGHQSKAENQALRQQAISLLTTVGLEDAIDLMPTSLSGGMRQRVALVRTLLQDKQLVLMDEPFSALDAVTRYQLQTLSSKLLKGKTLLFITHDPQEALRLADELYLMAGTPATMTKLALPTQLPPRDLNGDLSRLQQQIITKMEAMHD